MTTIDGKNDNYNVGDTVAQNAYYRIRSCTDSDGRELLFQIVSDAKHNNLLSNSSLILSRLKAASDEVEERFASAPENAGKVLNYDLGFPELRDNFILTKQGARQVNVLGFRSVKKIETVIPIVKIWKDSLRVDLPTSAWILGKLLKTISFAHDHRFQINKISGNNVLIEPDQHFVIVFDWSSTIIHETSVPPSICRKEIKLAAACIIKALGGDLDRARENDADLPYTNYLQSLATNGESNASKAHQTFYEIVDSLCDHPESTWKSGFNPFKTHSI